MRTALVPMLVVAFSGAGCVPAGGGSDPWGTHSGAGMDSAGPPSIIEVQPGTRTRILTARRTWIDGTAIKVANETLYFDGGKRVAMADIRGIWVADGRRVSGGRALAFATGGLFFGSAAGLAVFAIADPCGPSSGNPDADICLDGLGYWFLGAVGGTLGGLLWGLQPADHWVQIYPAARAVAPSRVPPEWRSARNLMR